MIFPGFMLGKPEFPILREPWSDKIKRITITTNRGKQVDAAYIPPESKTSVYQTDNLKHPAVIFAHGNAELIDHVFEECFIYSSLGVSVLLIEYPGYGRSGGRPSEATILDVYEKGYDLLMTMPQTDQSRIIFMGRSLGGGVACALSLRRRPAALILSSTFKSLGSFAAKYGAPSFLLRDSFDNLKAVKKYDGPVMIIHGAKDDMIPVAHGEALSKAAVNSEFITYDCRHNDCPPDMQVFIKDVKSFLKKYNLL